jgi:hypothetical protein
VHAVTLEETNTVRSRTAAILSVVALTLATAAGLAETKKAYEPFFGKNGGPPS